MQKEQGEESFYAIADDNNYYQGVAIGLMDSLSIKTVTAEKSYRFIEVKIRLNSLK